MRRQIEDDGRNATEFAPPRAKLRALPNPVDPPSENRARLIYPYGGVPDDAA